MTFLDHFLKLQVLYQSIFYYSAMIYFSSVTNITNTTQILLILLIVSLPHQKAGFLKKGMFIYILLNIAHTPKIGTGAHSKGLTCNE